MKTGFRHAVAMVAVALLLGSGGATAQTLAAYTPVQPVAAASIRPDLVVVEKSDRKLFLLRDGRILREYPVALGKNPVGHKQKQGDGRTPEGRYILDWRNPDSRFHRSIHISYPNESDIRRAEAVDQDPGDYIMIHGSPEWVPSVEWARNWLHRENWTDGCIAVTNDIMDEIWTLVKDGTPIEIRP